MKFRRYFVIAKPCRLYPRHCYYNWNDEEYSQFLIQIAHCLKPRYVNKGELIQRRGGGVEEATFIMQGRYKIGFFGLIKEDDFVNHWHELDYTYFSSLNVVGDYAMYCSKVSDIAYMCTQDIKGYALRNRDYKEIRE